jgi:hypothetical protein
MCTMESPVCVCVLGGGVHVFRFSCFCKLHVYAHTLIGIYFIYMSE